MPEYPAVDLEQLKENLNHQPCCTHPAMEYGHCPECYDTGCAHEPYMHSEVAMQDMRELIERLERVRHILSSGYGEAMHAYEDLREAAGMAPLGGNNV